MPKNEFKEIAEEISQMSAGERLIWANQVSFDMSRRMIKAAAEIYGKKGKEVVTTPLYDIGKELGERVCKILKINGKSPKDFAKLHHYVDTNLWGIKEEIIRGNSEEAIIRISQCPLQEIFVFEDCEAFFPYVRGLIDTINSRLEFKTAKALTKGDDCCEFVITFKEVDKVE